MGYWGKGECIPGEGKGSIHRTPRHVSSKKRTSNPRPFVFIVLNIFKTLVQNGGRVWNFSSVDVSAFLGRSSVLKQKNISCVDNPH